MSMINPLYSLIKCGRVHVITKLNLLRGRDSLPRSKFNFVICQREELLEITHDLTLLWLLLAHVFCQERFQKVTRTAVAQRYAGVGWNEGQFVTETEHICRSHFVWCKCFIKVGCLDYFSKIIYSTLGSTRTFATLLIMHDRCGNPFTTHPQIHRCQIQIPMLERQRAQAGSDGISW